MVVPLHALPPFLPFVKLLNTLSNRLLLCFKLTLFLTLFDRN